MKADVDASGNWSNPALLRGRRHGGTLIWVRVALTDKADEDIMYLDDIYRERQQ